jgi:hypothetical protein
MIVSPAAASAVSVAGRVRAVSADGLHADKRKGAPAISTSRIKLHLRATADP